MVQKRSYGDTCGVARALDVVGERWSLLLVRELLHGPKRFTDLREGLSAVSPDVLTERLRDLEQAGVVSRSTLPPPAASRVYALTDRGRELEPVVLALGRWGSREPIAPDSAPLSPDAFAVALQTLFDADAAAMGDASYEIRIGAQVFAVRVSDGRLSINRGTVATPDARVTTDNTATLARLLWHGASLAESEAAGALTIDGSTQAVERLRSLFAAPPAAGSFQADNDAARVSAQRSTRSH